MTYMIDTQARLEKAEYENTLLRNTITEKELVENGIMESYPIKEAYLSVCRELDAIKAENAALRQQITYQKKELSRLQTYEANFWRLIETAPRDGTEFIAAAFLFNRPIIKLVRFADRYDRFPIHENMSPWPVAPTYWCPLPILPCASWALEETKE